jgi:hypothetical protein
VLLAPVSPQPLQLRTLFTTTNSHRCSSILFIAAAEFPSAVVLVRLTCFAPSASCGSFPAFSRPFGPCDPYPRSCNAILFLCCFPPFSQVNGGSQAVRFLSTASGFPYLNLGSTPPQAHAHSSSPSAATQHAYAAQFLAAASASGSGHAKFLQPRQRTATASAVDAKPLPAFPCEKSAIDRIFQQQIATGRERAFAVNDCTNTA